ncbi:MAG: hypothetical protein R3E89_05705 [Thiolinea sp.]
MQNQGTRQYANPHTDLPYRIQGPAINAWLTFQNAAAHHLLPDSEFGLDVIGTGFFASPSAGNSFSIAQMFSGIDRHNGLSCLSAT